MGLLQVTRKLLTKQFWIILVHYSMATMTHDRKGVDSGQPFQPDYSGLPDLLVGLGRLNRDNQEGLIKNLSYEEITYIVRKECDNNKSPGLDGLPYELYQVTWDILGQDFARVLQLKLQMISLVAWGHWSLL